MEKVLSQGRLHLRDILALEIASGHSHAKLFLEHRHEKDVKSSESEPEDLSCELWRFPGASGFLCFLHLLVISKAGLLDKPSKHLCVLRALLQDVEGVQRVCLGKFDGSHEFQDAPEHVHTHTWRSKALHLSLHGLHLKAHVYVGLLGHRRVQGVYEAIRALSLVQRARAFCPALRACYERTVPGNDAVPCGLVGAQQRGDKAAALSQHLRHAVLQQALNLLHSRASLP
mmetsp:Transcript_34096/g.61348  ORF Transcript_34096/g.61348 Transcript_34096/m.61348 type:complete len:229 (-) Transcript_34096:511-1197(-)